MLDASKDGYQTTSTQVRHNITYRHLRVQTFKGTNVRKKEKIETYEKEDLEKLSLAQHREEISWMDGLASVKAYV